MGDARRRRLAGQAVPRGIRPKDDLSGQQRHVLAMIDRRIGLNPETNEIEMSDHSAKPNTYVSADLRTLYQWDGIRLRRLDRNAVRTHNTGHS